MQNSTFGVVNLQIHPETLEFGFPEELIAQEALQKRDEAKLLVIRRATREIFHRHFYDIADYLKVGDVLVLNKARVSLARVRGRKATGGRADIIFLEPTADVKIWKALVRPSMKIGTVVRFEEAGEVVLIGRTETGENLLRCNKGSVEQIMQIKGEVPLPPYIKREENDVRSMRDKNDYQTVYAAVPGSVAAPTAGLHFTTELLAKLAAQGVIIKEIILHVGWGTFRPVSKNIAEHKMMEERFEIPADAAVEIEKAKKENRGIIAVGTTATRALESWPAKTSSTDIFIKPGHEFRWLSGLVTNFHLPHSTPLALTAAFAGLPLLEQAYAEAIAARYRFFSYGDAMLIL